MSDATRQSGPVAAGANERPSPAPLGVTFWLVLSAYLSTAGWVLSALRQLNAGGYAVALILGAAAWGICQRGRIITDLKRVHPGRWVRRFKRPLPFGFFALAVLSLLGALMYLPMNYDALAYRVPRVLHWLAHGQWHWVHTGFPRLNVRGCGYEWLMAPMLALTGTTRWFFLPSIISYLLLPGLFFSVLTRVGVKRRVAWYWMWLLSAGFCYVAQSGSIANDLLGATYVMAGFDFALRLRQSKSLRDLWLFMLACGLMTGAKATNFPLLLPLFLLFIPNWRLLLLKPAHNLAVILFACAASFMPTAIFNLKYGGDWTGMNLEGPMNPHLDQLGINFTDWVLENLSPPVFPFSSQWERFIHKIPGLSTDALRSWTLGELINEEQAGIGVGIVLLVVLGLIASRRLRRVSGAKPARAVSGYMKLALWSSYFSLFVYAWKAQVQMTASRLIMSYYAPLIIPLVLFYFDERILQRRWWKAFVALAFAMSVTIVILAPGRPLWPALTVLDRLKAAHPESKLIARAQSVYWMYRQRPDCFAPLVAALPKDATVFGFLTFDDPETSLWWPLGSRRIEHVTDTDTREYLEAQGLKYIIVPARVLEMTLSADEVIRKYDAEVVAKVPLFIRTNPGLMDWYVLKINPQNPAAPTPPPDKPK